jgi:hypothetical protein
MSQSRKYRGYATQRIIAEYLVAQGWEHALPAGAGRSGSDITGVKGLDIEIKARKGFNPSATIKQLQERSKETGLGVGVMRLNGQGEKSVEEYVAILTLKDLVYLLKASGY